MIRSSKYIFNRAFFLGVFEFSGITNDYLLIVSI